MMYPCLHAIDIQGYTAFMGAEFGCKPGARSQDEIIKIVGDHGHLHQKHLIHQFHFIPDEDFQRVCECEMWTIICSKEKCPQHKPIFWGHKNIFQSPFIMVRNVSGELQPWPNAVIAKSVLEWMVDRQIYWDFIYKKEAEDQPLHDDLGDLINSLNRK